jgi:predicted NAD-dependent protein-ADP-ribosyltransferase YbiA (DUF1768 family)
MQPFNAKRYGQTLELIDNWELLKDNIMFHILQTKFKHWEMAALLKATEGKYLEETNYWGDRYWGADQKHIGQNRLGLMLMTIRKEWL